jgi:hypothetical protein
MNRQRDIERVLETWLVDGPSSMPDRLFDAVFDQVERVPQRRLARLRMRLTEMNPRIRIYTLAAAGLVVALVGLYLIGRGPSNDVGASPTPALSPTASPGSVLPAALRATWMGDPSGLAGLDVDAGVAMSFTDTTFHIEQAADDVQRLRSAVTALGANRFELATEGRDVTDCPEGGRGTYVWSLSPSGETLTLTSEGDDCATRLAAVPGTYWRMDCPTAEDDCLGSLDPGTYSSEFFDPYIEPGLFWTPRFGALTYTVPEGWVNVADWPDSFSLRPTDAPTTSNVVMISDAVAADRVDNCTERQDPDAGTTAQAIAEALERPGVAASSTAVTLGGLTGYRVDLSLEPSWTTPCPWSEGRPFALLVVDRPTAEGLAWGLDGETTLRWYLLDIAPNRAILLSIEAANPDDHATLLEAATPVVESFVFAP